MSQLEKYLEVFKNLETTLTATEDGWELRIDYVSHYGVMKWLHK
jgi:hypothetical protein